MVRAAGSREGRCMMRPIPLNGGANRVSQALLLRRTRQLATEGLDQESIIAALASEYPGLPSENHYANPAAIAVMERVRGRQQKAAQRRAHNEWRASKGMPELAEAHPETDEGDGPDSAALAAVRSAGELIRVCEAHGIRIGYNPDTRMVQLSRQIDTDGPLYRLLQKLKPSVVSALQVGRRSHG
jgi:hypothetical protein